MERNHSEIQEVTETASICGGFVLEQTNDTIIVIVQPGWWWLTKANFNFNDMTC
jgi:hypothetical protein